MKHIKAIFIKFVFVIASLIVVLGFIYRVSFDDIFMIGLLLTVALYVIGDLVILSRFGNLLATLADFAFAFLGVWFFGNMWIEENISLVTASFLSACLIALVEAFFHTYMEGEFFDGDQDEEKKSMKFTQGAFQSEFGEETFPEIRNPDLEGDAIPDNALLDSGVSYARYPNDNSDHYTNVANSTPLAKVMQFNTGLANSTDPDTEGDSVVDRNDEEK